MVMATPPQAIPLVPAERYELNQRRAASAWPELYDLLDAVKDPEVPVLSLWELGVLQRVEVAADGAVTVTIIPTYSGCPAMQQMREDIEACLRDAGYERVRIDQQLTPPWTSDYLDSEARQRLVRYGIAAPDRTDCPQCGSTDVSLISEFSSTACKAMFRCNQCLEPFDQFKRF